MSSACSPASRVEAANEVQKLIGLFSQASFRDSLRSSIAEEIIRTAETKLDQNFIYKNVVPTEVKAAARDAMRGAAYFAVDGLIAKPVWDILGALSFEVDQVITDVRGFDPYRGIGGQLRDLIVKRAVAEGDMVVTHSLLKTSPEDLGTAAAEKSSRASRLRRQCLPTFRHGRIPSRHQRHTVLSLTPISLATSSAPSNSIFSSGLLMFSPS